MYLPTLNENILSEEKNFDEHIEKCNSYPLPPPSDTVMADLDPFFFFFFFALAT